MSVAFTKEESAETAAEAFLPDRPIPPGLNLVTEAGLAALSDQLEAAKTAYEAAQVIDDINERLRLSTDRFELPPIEVPEPVESDGARQALVSFDDDWITATRALIARKRYEISRRRRRVR